MATIAVGAAVVLYVLWTNGSAAQGLSIRALAGIVFALGWVGCTSDASTMATLFAPAADRAAPLGYVVAVSLVGAVALVSGIVAIVGSNETMLAVLVGSTTGLWIAATFRHAVGLGVPHPAQ